MRIQLSNHGFIDIPSTKDLFYLNIKISQQSYTSKTVRYSISISAIYNVYVSVSSETLPVNINDVWACDITIKRNDAHDAMLEILNDNIHRTIEMIDAGEQEIINIPKELTKGMVD